MDQNVRVNIMFQADTTLAQQNIKALGQSLRTVANTKIGFNSGPIAQAAKDAQQLQVHLQNALNTNTGKLDLTKLNTSLRSAGTSLKQLTSSLTAAGPAGQQAFTQVAMAISQAEVPAMRLGARTRELMTTLGNTMKWQLASTAIHKVSSAINEATSYVKKFDEALTEIRMVSKLNDTQMLSFVEDTRKIAKEVNATALEIAQGSAIFFQQGLPVEEVEARMAITAKMAHVTGTSVENVSSQLTAIWNNFAHGTETLESYADKIAWLGASTASTTDQIATAMQKFAASAETVGLSYDYAATAVAQVIDRTQMAPEEVGTAFKTILTRLQGLELGETLEDGVDLNKYSQALKVVGVDVLDVNDSLRDADDILNDLGEKWDSLDAAEKKALSTTVAGVRQQTQFIALMEEWDDVEDMVDDIGASQNYLNIQNAKYADSIEGVKKRFTEAKNELFDELLNDDNIKSFYSVLTDIVKVVDNIIEGFGGIGPMIWVIIGLLSKTLFPMVLNGVRAVTAGIQNALGITEARIKNLQAEFNKEVQLKINTGQLTDAQAKQLTLSQELQKTKERLTEATRYMGDAEKQLVQNQIQLLEYNTQNLQAELQKKDAMEQQLQLEEKMFMAKNRKAVGTSSASNSYLEQGEKYFGSDFKSLGRGIAVQDRQSVVNMANSQTLQDLSAQVNNQTIRYQKYDKTTRSNIHDNKEKLLREIHSKEKAINLKQNKQAEQQAIINNKDKPEAERLAAQTQLNKLTKEEKALQDELEKKLEKINRNEEYQLEKAKQALELKRQMNSETKTADNSSVIKTNKMGLGLGENPDKNYVKESANIFAKQTAELGITTEKDTATIQTSMQNFEGLAKKQGELLSISQRLTQQRKELNSIIQQGVKVEKNATTGTKNFTAETKNNIKQVKSYGRELIKQGKNLGLSKDQMKSLGESYKKLGSTDAATVTQGMQEISTFAKEMGHSIDNAQDLISAAADQMVADFIELGNMDEKSLEKLKNGLIELGYTAEQADAKVKKTQQDMQNMKPPISFGGELTRITSSVASFAGQVGMAISGIQMLGQAFNEDAEPLQRMMSLFSGLAMTLPGVVTIITTLTKAMKLSTYQKIQDTMATWAKIAADKAEEAQNKKGLASKLWSAAASTLERFSKLPAPFGFFAGLAAAGAILGLIGVGIAAVSGAFSTTTAREKEQAEENKNVAGTVEEIGKAYDNAKKSVEEFKTTISEYDEGIDALSELKKGTEEYSEKLDEVNAKAKELINTYGLWGDYKINAETGVYEIDEEALERVEQEQKDTLASVEQTQKAANILVGTTAKDHVIEKASIIGLFRNNISNIEPKIQTAADSGREFSVGMDDEAFLSELKELGYSDYSSDILGLKDEFINAVNVTREADENTKRQTQGLIESKVSNEADFLIKESLGSSYNDVTANAISGIVAKNFAEEVGDKIDKAIMDRDVASLEATDKNQLKIAKEKYGGDMTYEQLTREYAVAMGYATQAEVDAATYNSKDWKSGLKTAQGETILEGVYLEDMVRTMMLKQIQEEITGEVIDISDPAFQNYVESMGTLAKNLNVMSQGLGDTVLTAMQTSEDGTLDLSDSFGQFATQKQVDALFKDENGNRITDPEKFMKNLGLDTNAFEEYGNMTAEEFMQSFEEGMADWSLDKYIEAKQQAAETLISSSAETYGLDAEVLKTQTALIQDNTKVIDDNTKELKNNAEAAAKIAIANQRLNKGVNTLTDNWEDWKKTLKGTDRMSQDYAESVTEINKALKDILNITSEEEIIPADFWRNAENIDLMDQIANGSEEAVDKIGRNLLKAQVEAQKYTEDIGNNIVNAFDGVDTEATAKNNFEYYKQELIAAVDQMQEKLDTLDPGKAFKGQKAKDFANALNDYALAVGMTAEQMNDYLSKAGVEAELTTENVTMTRSIPVTETIDKIYTSRNQKDENGDTYTERKTVSETRVVENKPVTESVPVAQINMGKTGKKPKINKINRGNITNSVTTSGKASSSGGDNKPSKTDKTKKTDVVERYKEVTDELDELGKAAEDASDAVDKLYGNKKISAMKEQSKILKEEIKTLEKKRKEAEKYLKIDAQELLSTGASAGLNFKFDKNGNISNYTSEMTKLYNQISKAEEHYNSLPSKDAQEEYQKNTLDPLKKKAERIKNALSDYEGTLDVLDEIEDQIEDYADQLEEIALNIIDVKVQFRLELNERDLAVIEDQLAGLEDRSFSTAEKMTLIGEQTALALSDQKAYRSGIRETLKNAGMDSKTISQVLSGEKTLTEKEINSLNIDEKTRQQLYDYTDGLLENNERLIELYQSLPETFMEVHEEWVAEIDNAMAKIEYLGSVLENYQNIVDLTGKKMLKMNNETLTAMSKAQVENAKATLAASKDRYEGIAASYQYYKDLIEADPNNKNSKAWKETLRTLEEEMRDAEAEISANWVAALEKAQEDFSNSVNLILEDFKDGIAGIYDNIDDLQSAFDKQQQISELIFKDYQKIYETSKLMRNINKSLDETDNIKAQKELNSLLAEVNEYQKAGKEMSQYDIDYLQKKYELMLAEIALEEAQNAKSSVRLTQDSEGNWGYVYSADEATVSETQQNYEDKLYELQNFVNESQTTLTEQYIQAWADCFSEIEALQASDYASQTEYQAAIQAIYDHYSIIANNAVTEIEELTGRSAEINSGYGTTLADTYHETYLGSIYPVFESFGRLMSENETLIKDTIDNLSNSFETWELYVSEIFGLAGSSINSFTDEAKTMASTVKTKSKNAADDIDEMKGDMVSDIKDISEAIEDWLGQYGSKIDNAVSKNTEMVESVNGITGSYGLLEDQLEDLRKQANKTREALKKLVNLKGQIDVDKNNGGDGDNDSNTNGFTGKKGDSKEYTQKQDDYEAIQITKSGHKNGQNYMRLDNGEWYAFSELTEHKDDKKTIYTIKKGAKKQDTITGYETKTLDNGKVVVKGNDGYWYNQKSLILINNSNNQYAVIDGAGKQKNPYAWSNSKYKLGNKIYRLKEDGFSPPGIAPKVNSVTIKDNKITGSDKKYAHAALAGKSIKDITYIDNGYYYQIEGMDKSHYIRGAAILKAFDTGGYTGEWDSSGKLAMLHQKEIVLNAHDTENFLDAIGIVRGLADKLDLQTLVHQMALSQYRAGQVNQSPNNELQQSVVITAEFPNATEKSEIEAAFETLINQSSQFANRFY